MFLENFLYALLLVSGLAECGLNWAFSWWALRVMAKVLNFWEGRLCRLFFTKTRSLEGMLHLTVLNKRRLTICCTCYTEDFFFLFLNAYILTACRWCGLHFPTNTVACFISLHLRYVKLRCSLELFFQDYCYILGAKDVLPKSNSLLFM